VGKTKKKKASENIKEYGIFKNNIVILSILTVSIITAGLYLYSMLFYTQGHLSLPISEAFYQFQYAKQLADGEFFRYYSGDNFSTGAGGFLYPLILMIGFLFGITNSGIIIYIFILGIILLFISGLLLFFIGQEIINKEVGIITCFLFLLNGPILWIYFGGTETLLFTFLIINTIYFFLRGIKRDRYLGVIISSCLLSLVRFEGILLVWMLVIILLINFVIFSQKDISKIVLCIIPICSGIFHLFMNFLLTRNPLPNTIYSESTCFQPNTPLPEVLVQASRYCFFLLKDIFSGFSGEFYNIINPNEGQVSSYFPPFSLFFALIGVSLLGNEILSKSLKGLTLCVSWFFGGIFISSILYSSHSSWNINVIPYYPIFIFLVATGIYIFSQIVASILSDISLKQIVYSFFGFFLVFSIFSTFYFSVTYGKSCYNVYYYEIVLGKKIKEIFPQDVLLITKGMSTLTYFGERATLDITGRGSTGMAIPFRHGAGSIFEALESKNINNLKSFFILPENELNLESSGLLGERVHSVKMVTIEKIPPLVVYKAEKRYIHSGDSCVSIPDEIGNWLLVDNIDVADIQDEKAHQYRFWEREHKSGATTYALNLPCLGERTKILADGGRIFSGGEEMVIKTKPFKQMKIIVRTKSAFEVEIDINNHRKIWKSVITSEVDYWIESVVEIPGEWITSEYTKIKIYVKGEKDYTPAHYWFYQC
jgi:hypothetical protein